MTVLLQHQRLLRFDTRRSERTQAVIGGWLPRVPAAWIPSTTLEYRHDSLLARLDTVAGRLRGEVSHLVLRERRLPAIPSSTRAIPSLARGTAVPVPSTLSQNDVLRLAAGPEAVLIAPGHKDDRCHALLRDGSDVGIRPISDQQSSVLTYEKHPAVDNRVGVSPVGLVAGRPRRAPLTAPAGSRRS